jgi:hypothetical protein
MGERTLTGLWHLPRPTQMLWVKKKADSDYLKKLVEGMPSRLL